MENWLFHQRFFDPEDLLAASVVVLLAVAWERYEHTYFPSFIRFNRWSRSWFIWVNVIINGLGYLIGWHIEHPSLLILTIPMHFIGWILIVRRTHDINRSALYSLLAIMPLLRYYLLFKRGTIGPNDYGEDPLVQ